MKLSIESDERHNDLDKLYQELKRDTENFMRDCIGDEWTNSYELQNENILLNSKD